MSPYLSPEEHAFRTRNDSLPSIRAQAAKRLEPKRERGNGSYIVTPNGVRLSIMFTWQEDGQGYASLMVGKEAQAIVKTSESAVAVKRTPIAFCKGPECERKVVAKGMCTTHHKQMATHGTLTVIAKSNRGKPKPQCKGPECDWVSAAKGYCMAHYTQMRQGRPLRPVRRVESPNNIASSDRGTHDDRR